MDMPTDTLSEVNAKIPNDNLANVKVVALVPRQLATYWATWRPRH